MKPHIYKYLISLCLLWATFSVSAQKQKQDSTKVSEKLFRNFRVEADMVPLAMLALGNNEIYSFEGAVQTNLLGKCSRD